jgi:bifunctional DNA-binding transcriptional regulator/antitoxin component of YhaV-PrlF toxin-antitoxin module
LPAPTAEFERAVKRFPIGDNFWPFTIEKAFPAALGCQAMAEGAYAAEEATLQAAHLADPATAKNALTTAHQLALAGNDALFYFRPPTPETKLAFARWLAAPQRRDHSTFAAFGPILDRLRILSRVLPQTIFALTETRILRNRSPMTKVRLRGNQLTLPEELRRALAADEDAAIDAIEVDDGVLLKRSPASRRLAGHADVRAAQAGVRYLGTEPRPPAEAEEREIAEMLAADKADERADKKR